MRQPFHYTLVLLGMIGMAVLSVAACDSDEIPTAPDPPTVTDTFSGSLNVNGATIHTFTTQAAGTVTATVIALEPAGSATVGFSVGVWNALSNACQLVWANDAAAVSAVFNGRTQTGGGNFCVRMYDPGRITETISYTVEVVHP
jgi:hypothetical protein